MSIKTVLVALVGADGAESPLETGFLLAREFRAHVEGVFAPIDVIELVPARYRARLSGHSGVLEDVKHDIERQGKELRQRFTARAEGLGFETHHNPPSPHRASVSWRTTRGPASDVVRRMGGAYDIIVVGRPDGPGLGPADESASVVEAALFGTGRPALVAPATAPESLGKTVMIGWNRSPQAARAVERAIPFLARAERVVIHSIATGAKEGPTAQDIARYLAWHDIEGEVREMAPDQRSVGEGLLAEARNAHADLLVMGAYSHSRFRAMIWGGVTRHVLAHAAMPVLMSR